MISLPATGLPGRRRQNHCFLQHAPRKFLRHEEPALKLTRFNNALQAVSNRRSNWFGLVWLLQVGIDHAGVTVCAARCFFLLCCALVTGLAGRWPWMAWGDRVDNLVHVGFPIPRKVLFFSFLHFFVIFVAVSRLNVASHSVIL